MDKSPLSKLPAEIRNSIYELALKQKKPFIFKPTGKNDQFVDWKLVKDPNAHSTTLALSETCRAVNNECKQLIFTINTFVLRFGHASGESSEKSYDGMLEGFCLHLGQANVSALRSVVVQVARFQMWDTVMMEPDGQSGITATLPATIAVVQKGPQSQLKLASVSVKFCYEYDELYEAESDLRELSGSWDCAMIKLQKQVRSAQATTARPNDLDLFLRELAVCQKSSTK